MKRKRVGFTIVELLTVLAVIALLASLITVAGHLVIAKAKEAKTRAQLAGIDLHLVAWRNDFGDYPQSSNNNGDYCGAQKLAEALVGWDLLGFHPDSDFLSSGMDLQVSGRFLYNTNDPVEMNMRRGLYLPIETANPFRLGFSAPGARDGLWETPGSLAPNTFVLCDAFGVQPVVVGGGKTVKAGTPILYYRAGPARVLDPANFANSTYNPNDNIGLIGLGRLSDGVQHELIKPHPFGGAAGGELYDYDNNGGIADSKVPPPTANTWRAHRPDSYILISAGADGLYGTSDDIRNF